MMNFVAIDFETASSSPNSACSVAVVEVKDGRMKDSYYSLIRPPRMYFHPINIQIHGIHPEDVRDQPDFRGIWPELRKRLEGHIVVAHNAQFDMRVLRASLDTAGLIAPQFSHCCTVSLSRRAWPQLKNHKLDTVGDYLHIDFQHHNALADAQACAEIPLCAGRKFHIDSLTELAAAMHVAVKPFR